MEHTYEYKLKERMPKIYIGISLQRLSGMQRARCSGKTNPGTLRAQARGSGCYRKKVKAAAMETITNPRRHGRKQQIIPTEQYQRVFKELSETKDALAVVAIILDFILDNM